MSRLTLTFFIIFIPFIVQAQFAGGTGDTNDPYKIQNLEQLQMIAEYPESNFILISDIDASSTKEWNEGKGFKPIGSQEIPFRRSALDGKNYTITDLYINRPEENHVGLFGYAEQSTFKNIILEQVNIRGGMGTGSLAGIAEGSNFYNVSVSGNVTGGTDTGGLAGSAPTYDDYYPEIGFSTVRYANTNISVKGENNVGGLIGSLDGFIHNSYATGDVVGNEYVGGLVGFKLFGMTESSFATGNVTGITRVGGISGSCDDYWIRDWQGQCTYQNIYSTGNIEGDEMVGGLIGELKNEDVLTESYALGNIIGSDTSGAVVGNKQGYSMAVYWDSTMSDQTSAIGSGDYSGITALKTQEMKGDSALKYMEGFDFEKVWIPVEDNYPELLWTKTPGWIEQKHPVYVTLNEYENGIDEVTFKWFSMDTVSSYHLQVYVYDDHYYKNLILDQEAITEDSVAIALNLESQTRYYWRVRAKNDFGYNPWSLRVSFETMITTSIEEESIPEQVYLHQNYPNPFNPATNISYELSKAGPVKLEVYNLLGKKVATLVNENKSMGVHSVHFDASGLSSGFYFYRLETETTTHQKKLLFLK